MDFSITEFLKIDEICSKWLISNSNLDSKLEQIYQALIQINFDPVIKSFTERLNSVPYTFTKTEQTSGSIAYFGAIFTSLLNTGKVEEIEGLFTFALCYMLVDHFLDDIKNSEIDKKQTMKELKDFLIHDIYSDNKLIIAAKDRYLSLISKNPKVKTSLIRLLESELKGAAISNNQNLSREEYKQIAKEKGGRTSSAIAQIIGIDHDENSPHFICGSLIQYVDDLLDLKDDAELNIYTLARYDYEHDNLDQYIYETILEIDQLDSIYNFFKAILMAGVILGVHDNPDSISQDLLQVLKKYDPFSKNVSKDSLNDWFHNKLYGYIENKNDLQIKIQN